jgi:GNAT superfamily N-acetyltransferase
VLTIVNSRCELPTQFIDGMKTKMRIKLEASTPEGAGAIAALRNATAEKLTAEFGRGVWSSSVTEKGVLLGMRTGKVFVAKSRGKVFATLTLSTKKPWAIDTKYFSPAKRPLYLTAMAVATDRQRTGVGRACVETVKKLYKKWPEMVRGRETLAQHGVRKICQEWAADAIRLDAYDAMAGAGPFYQKCGFQEVGRTSYHGTPLVYYEMML